MKPIVFAAALAAASSVVAPASARDGFNPGVAAAIGVVGGLAAGAAIAGSASQPYYPGRPVYAPPPPRPVYYAPPAPRVYVEEEYAPACFVRSRRFYDEFGDVIVGRERVCR